jgi:hypothetical protein
MSQPFHFRKVFMSDTIIIWTPRREVNFNSSLKHERNKEWKENGLEKCALQTKVPHTLYKGTHE